jgi:hypothetical protein
MEIESEGKSVPVKIIRSKVKIMMTTAFLVIICDSFWVSFHSTKRLFGNLEHLG